MDLIRGLLQLGGVGCACFALGLYVGYRNPGAAWEPLVFWSAIGLSWVCILTTLAWAWAWRWRD